MGFGESCAKCGLVTFNIIFLLSGIVVLGVGIWVKVDKNVVNMQHLVQFDSKDTTLNTASSVLIGFGAFVLVVSLLGFCSAFCTNNTKFFVGGYIFFIVVIFVGELAVGVLIAVNKGKIDAKLNSVLTKSLAAYKPGQSLNSKAWDYVQVWLKCCGANGPDDYTNVTFPSHNMSQYVPDTCCVLVKADPERPTPRNKTACQSEAFKYRTSPEVYPDLYTKGCHEGIADAIRSHLKLLIGIAIGIGFLQLLGIMFACVVCQKADKYYSL